MDQLQRVKDIVKMVTYKPDWKLEVTMEPPYQSGLTQFLRQRIFITVSMKSMDAEHPEKSVMIRRHVSHDVMDVAHMTDKNILEYFVKRSIWEMEMHEFEEWFKFDGVCVFDPHPELTAEKITLKKEINDHKEQVNAAR